MSARSRSRRIEEKRRRRERRHENRRREAQADGVGILGEEFPGDSPPWSRPGAKRRMPGFETIDKVIRALQAFDLLQPGSWPGAADPILARPDRIKFELGAFIQTNEPWGSKMQALEARMQKGPLGSLPEIDHWAMEEFLWHGTPGDDFTPLDAFLVREGRRFPPAAREQIRRWKKARLDAFEVGELDRGTVALTPWDLIHGAPSGPPFRAITLNIGGVNAYRKLRGSITITYIAPWAPDENLFCGMGYGITPSKAQAVMMIPYLGLQKPAAAARIYPWKENVWKEREYASLWKIRDWQGWLKEGLVFPFQALVPAYPDAEFKIMTVTRLLDVDAEQAHRFGIYLECPRAGEVYLAGATAVTPIDIASPNTAALAEYQAYRDLAGPPPGARDMPRFFSR